MIIYLLAVLFVFGLMVYGVRFVRWMLQGTARQDPLATGCLGWTIGIGLAFAICACILASALLK